LIGKELGHRVHEGMELYLRGDRLKGQQIPVSVVREEGDHKKAGEKG